MENTTTTVWTGVGDDLANLSLRTSTPLVVGYNLSGFAKALPGTNTSADREIYAIAFEKNAASSIKENGVFAALAPTNLYWNQIADGYLRFNSIDETNLRDYKIGEKDTDLYYQNATAPYVDFYNQFLGSGKKQTINLAANNAANVIIAGTISNTNWTFGDGNNIFVVSPTMNTFTAQVTNSGSTLPNKEYTNIFYPASQGLLHSNDLRFGNGDNLVYYDSSFKNIKTGNGNNIFVPSFGSFNWAANDLLYLPSNMREPYAGFNLAPTQRTLLTPIPQNGLVEGSQYSVGDLYTGVLNYSQGTYPGTENAFQWYFGDKASVDNNYNNTIGGLRIVGGKGNDIFYGFDPDFYSSIPTRKVYVVKKYNSDQPYDKRYEYNEYQANREVFTKFATATNERFSQQNYQTTEILGGEGNNIFYLGNPTKMAADGSKYIGDYAYRLSLTHKTFADLKSQNELSWGNGADSITIVNVNLSANVETYTISSSSFDQDKGSAAPGTNGYDTTKLGASLTNTTNKFFDKILEKGKVWKFIPVADFAVTAVSTIVDTIKWFASIFGGTAPDPEPIQLTTEQTSQPLGNWKQSIAINDWNPNLALNITVDPTTTGDFKPGSQGDLRWRNLKFEILDGQQTSNGLKGAKIIAKQGDGVSQELFHLEGFGADANPLYGYKSYNFLKNTYQGLETANLAFFGNIAHGIDAIKPLQNYESSINNFVFSSDNPSINSAYGKDSYSFYWGDPGMDPITGEAHNPAWLDAARNQSSSLTIKFDSRSLGWFWQPAFKEVSAAAGSNVEDKLEVDTAKSKLWVSKNPGVWMSYSFDQLETDPLAFSYALRAKTFYSVTKDGEMITSRDQMTSEVIANSLELFSKVANNLSVLRKDAPSNFIPDSLQQITYAKYANPQDVQSKTLTVYYLAQDYRDFSSDVFEMKVISKDDEGKQLEIKGVQATSRDYIYALERQDNVDIDLDGLVGAPAVSYLLQQANVKSQENIGNMLNIPAIGGDAPLAWSSANPPSAGAVVGSKIVNTEDLVRAFYQACLNREADPEGLKAWVHELDFGQLKNSEVLANFLSSEEFLSREASTKEFVSDLYAHLLMRAPDPAGFKAWQNTLDDGLAASEVVKGFTASAEFKALIGIAPSGLTGLPVLS